MAAVTPATGPQPPPYGAPPGSSVVYIQQPGYSRANLNYHIPKALVPGILLIILSVLNLCAYIAVGVLTLIFHEIIINAFIFYLVTGILAVVAARKNMYGVVIAALIWTIIALILTVIYFILTCLDLTYYSWYPPTVTYDIIMLIFILIAFACIVAIMVFSSQVLCCRGAANNPVGPGAPANTGMVLAPPPQQKY